MTLFLLSKITNLRLHVSLWFKNPDYILSETMYIYLQQYRLEYHYAMI